MKRYLVLLALAHSLSISYAAAPSALYYTGSGYVAGGKTDTLTSDQGYHFKSLNAYSKGRLSFSVDGYPLSEESQNTQTFLLYLAAPNGDYLQTGFYDGATRAAFWPHYDAILPPDEPGLWFAGNGRGSSQTIGSFNILDIQFDGNTLTSLAVDFVQNEDLGPTYGSFRYQSYVPLTTTIPEPTSYLLMLTGLAAIIGRRFHRQHHEPQLE